MSIANVKQLSAQHLGNVRAFRAWVDEKTLDGIDALKDAIDALADHSPDGPWVHEDDLARMASERDCFRGEVRMVEAERDAARADLEALGDRRDNAFNDEVDMRLKAQAERDAARAQVARLREALARTRDALRSEIAMPHTCSDCGWNVGGVPKGLHNFGCRVANAADDAMNALDEIPDNVAWLEGVKAEARRQTEADLNAEWRAIQEPGKWPDEKDAIVRHDARVRAATLEEAAKVADAASEARWSKIAIARELRRLAKSDERDDDDEGDSL